VRFVALPAHPARRIDFPESDPFGQHRWKVARRLRSLPPEGGSLAAGCPWSDFDPPLPDSRRIGCRSWRSRPDHQRPFAGKRLVRSRASGGRQSTADRDRSHRPPGHFRSGKNRGFSRPESADRSGFARDPRVSCAAERARDDRRFRPTSVAPCIPSDRSLPSAPRGVRRVGPDRRVERPRSASRAPRDAFGGLRSPGSQARQTVAVSVGHPVIPARHGETTEVACRWETETGFHRPATLRGGRPVWLPGWTRFLVAGFHPRFAPSSPFLTTLTVSPSPGPSGIFHPVTLVGSLSVRDDLLNDSSAVRPGGRWCWSSPEVEPPSLEMGTAEAIPRPPRPGEPGARGPSSVESPSSRGPALGQALSRMTKSVRVGA